MTWLLLFFAIVLGAAFHAIICGRAPWSPEWNDWLWPWWLIRWCWRKVTGDRLR